MFLVDIYSVLITVQRYFGHQFKMGKKQSGFGKKRGKWYFSE